MKYPSILSLLYVFIRNGCCICQWWVFCLVGFVCLFVCFASTEMTIWFLFFRLLTYLGRDSKVFKVHMLYNLKWEELVFYKYSVFKTLWFRNSLVVQWVKDPVLSLLWLGLLLGVGSVPGPGTSAWCNAAKKKKKKRKRKTNPQKQKQTKTNKQKNYLQL